MKPYDTNNPFKTRQGKKITNLDRYVEVLKENNIPFSDEQYKEAKNELYKCFKNHILIKNIIFIKSFSICLPLDQIIQPTLQFLSYIFHIFLYTHILMI